MNKPEIKEAVLNTLRACGKPLGLPVPIKKITKSAFRNVRLIQYSTQMKHRNMSYEDMLSFAGTADAITLIWICISSTTTMWINPRCLPIDIAGI